MVVVMENQHEQKEFFDRFFEEKVVKNVSYVIKHNKSTFVIETKALIKAIPYFTKNVRDSIERGLRIVDLVNGNVDEFLEKQAELYVKMNF